MTLHLLDGTASLLRLPLPAPRTGVPGRASPGWAVPCCPSGQPAARGGPRRPPPHFLSPAAGCQHGAPLHSPGDASLAPAHSHSFSLFSAAIRRKVLAHYSFVVPLRLILCHFSPSDR